ncbi:hypothetical protein RFI_02122 [Reticulomyxa filosa]|uniref:Uncharacterized protein n=1 Tax=Reticulomyxa filosa TaxID=46433 RepID=X6P9U8_RETFI|nr:hypothetical protein RFI_02122 [Reticulomyxa filosa]|eukprot:ETO34951.1 hypothetical protein RFI_02122 [Reticulomyxa filosa]
MTTQSITDIKSLKREFGVSLCFLFHDHPSYQKKKKKKNETNRDYARLDNGVPCIASSFIVELLFHFGKTGLSGGMDKQKSTDNSFGQKKSTKFDFFFLTKNKQSEQETMIIVNNWTRSQFIYWGWVDDFNKIIARYVKCFKQFKVFKGHSRQVTSAKFSPDGARIVSSSDDRTIRIWDVSSGKEVQTLKGHADWINNAEFSPEGTKIVSSSVDRSIRLWDVTSGKEMKRLIGHSNRVTKAQFAPDGHTVVSCSWDQTIRLWDVKSGQEIKRIHTDLYQMYDVQFSPDGKHVVVSSDDTKIEVWNVNTSARVHSLGGHLSYVKELNFHPMAASLRHIPEIKQFGYGMQYQEKR